VSRRVAFSLVLECVEVVRGTRQTLIAACVMLAATADLHGHEQPAIELGETRSRSASNTATHNQSVSE
jgi:hypothetical protein